MYNNVLGNYMFILSTGFVLHFSLYTAIATIKVHLAAMGALYLVTLLAHKRVLVNLVNERFLDAVSIALI